VTAKGRRCWGISSAGQASFPARLPGQYRSEDLSNADKISSVERLPDLIPHDECGASNESLRIAGTPNSLRSSGTSRSGPAKFAELDSEGPRRMIDEARRRSAYLLSGCAALAASRRAFSFTWVEQQCPISQWYRSLHSCEQ
jgi:hypothetical protein